MLNQLCFHAHLSLHQSIQRSIFYTLEVRLHQRQYYISLITENSQFIFILPSNTSMLFCSRSERNTVVFRDNDFQSQIKMHMANLPFLLYAEPWLRKMDQTEGGTILFCFTVSWSEGLPVLLPTALKLLVKMQQVSPL